MASFSALMSIAITRVAGASARTICSAMWPSPPTPMMASVRPGPNLGCTLRTAR
jgi:hypothetical protein